MILKTNQVYHPWDKWECFASGFYNTDPPDGLTREEAKEAYATFLRDTQRFDNAIKRVMVEWPISCEQFLSNEHINRVAWIGQSAMFIETGVPCIFCGGFRLLSNHDQTVANVTALKALTGWLIARRAAEQKISQSLPLFDA